MHHATTAKPHNENHATQATHKHTSTAERSAEWQTFIHTGLLTFTHIYLRFHTFTHIYTQRKPHKRGTAERCLGENFCAASPRGAGGARNIRGFVRTLRRFIPTSTLFARSPFSRKKESRRETRNQAVSLGAIPRDGNTSIARPYAKAGDPFAARRWSHRTAWASRLARPATCQFRISFPLGRQPRPFATDRCNRHREARAPPLPPRKRGRNALERLAGAAAGPAPFATILPIVENRSLRRNGTRARFPEGSHGKAYPSRTPNNGKRGPKGLFLCAESRLGSVTGAPRNGGE